MPQHGKVFESYLNRISRLREARQTSAQMDANRMCKYCYSLINIITKHLRPVREGTRSRIHNANDVAAMLTACSESLHFINGEEIAPSSPPGYRDHGDCFDGDYVEDTFRAVHGVNLAFIVCSRDCDKKKLLLFQ